MYYYMTIDIHKAITGNIISKNLLKPWGSNSNPNSLGENYLINIQDLEIPLKNRQIFIRIRVKYTKSMILQHQIMIDAQCCMM